MKTSTKKLVSRTTIQSTFSQKFLTQIFTWGGLIGTFLLASCSDMNTEPMEMDSQISKILPDQTFTLVPSQNEPIQIYGMSEAPKGASFRSTQAAGNDRGRFNITLQYVVDITDRQREVFESAAARWERIIIRDVPSITGTIPSAFQGLPPVIDGGTIDDILIEVVIAPIDGPGGILGQAGPRFTRTVDRLPVTGVMFFDVDDLDFLESLDLFEDVIVHEMGHVLGIGTLWNFGGRELRQGPTANPFFTGKTANTHWNAEGGTDALPVENMGGQGTALSHWRESILRNELMTGFLNLGVNPLSRITAGSLRDLGYGTALVGEQYELERGTPGVDISDLAASGTLEGLHIAEMEVLLKPIGFVTTD